MDSTENRKVLAKEIKDYLLDDMLKCWEERTVDNVYGGYITDFDRKWNINSYNKGAWGQARQIYTFSAAYEKLEQDEKWKRMAKVGIDFMLNKMYAKNGRFNYLVSREGDVLDGTISVFSDAFFISGLAKYISVFGEKKYILILDELFETYKKNILDENFSDYAPFRSGKDIINHSGNMIAFSTAYEVQKVLGRDATEDLITRSIKNIFDVLYDEKTNLIYELKEKDGSFIEGGNSRIVTVGHNYETLWFVLEYAIERGDEALIEKIKSIAETLNVVGKDKKGDSVYAIDPYGDGVKFTTWKYEVPFNMDDIVSWAYAEEMVLWAKLWALTKEEKYYFRFKKIYDFCKEHFEDKEYGDWFHSLDNNYNVNHDFKGSTVKSAYHMPRALMRIIDSLSE